MSLPDASAKGHGMNNNWGKNTKQIPYFSLHGKKPILGQHWP